MIPPDGYIYFFIILNLGFSFFFYKTLVKYLTKKNRLNILSYFSELYAIFNTCKEDAFISIYRQELSTIIMSKVSNTEKMKALKEKEEIYIKKVIEMCGPKVIEDLKDIYGNTDSIILNINTYYISKILETDMEINESYKNSFTEEELQEMNFALNKVFK